MTVLHFLSKIRAIHSENLMGNARSFLEGNTKTLKYVGWCKLPGEVGGLPYFFFFCMKIEVKCIGLLEKCPDYGHLWVNLSMKTQF